MTTKHLVSMTIASGDQPINHGMLHEKDKGLARRLPYAYCHQHVNVRAK